MIFRTLTRKVGTFLLKPIVGTGDSALGLGQVSGRQIGFRISSEARYRFRGQGLRNPRKDLGSSSGRRQSDRPQHKCLPRQSKAQRSRPNVSPAASAAAHGPRLPLRRAARSRSSCGEKASTLIHSKEVSFLQEPNTDQPMQQPHSVRLYNPPLGYPTATHQRWCTSKPATHMHRNGVETAQC